MLTSLYYSLSIHTTQEQVIYKSRCNLDLFRYTPQTDKETISTSVQAVFGLLLLKLSLLHQWVCLTLNTLFAPCPVAVPVFQENSTRVFSTYIEAYWNYSQDPDSWLTKGSFP